MITPEEHSMWTKMVALLFLLPVSAFAKFDWDLYGSAIEHLRKSSIVVSQEVLITLETSSTKVSTSTPNYRFPSIEVSRIISEDEELSQFAGLRQFTGVFGRAWDPVDNVAKRKINFELFSASFDKSRTHKAVITITDTFRPDLGETRVLTRGGSVTTAPGTSGIRREIEITFPELPGLEFRNFQVFGIHPSPLFKIHPYVPLVASEKIIDEVSRSGSLTDYQDPHSYELEPDTEFENGSVNSQLVFKSVKSGNRAAILMKDGSFEIIDLDTGKTLVVDDSFKGSAKDISLQENSVIISLDGNERVVYSLKDGKQRRYVQTSTNVFRIGGISKDCAASLTSKEP